MADLSLSVSPFFRAVENKEQIIISDRFSGVGSCGFVTFKSSAKRIDGSRTDLPGFSFFKKIARFFSESSFERGSSWTSG